MVDNHGGFGMANKQAVVVDAGTAGHRLPVGWVGARWLGLDGLVGY